MHSGSSEVSKRQHDVGIRCYLVPTAVHDSAVVFDELIARSKYWLIPLEIINL